MKHIERRELKQKYIDEIWQLHAIFKAAFTSLAPIPEKVVYGSFSLVARYKRTADAFAAGKGFWYKRGFGRAFKLSEKNSLREIEAAKKTVKKTAADFGLAGGQS